MSFAWISPPPATRRFVFVTSRQGRRRRGLEEDGEDIEVLELSLDTALAMISTAEIADAKTIMLLQYAKLHGVLE